MQEMTCLPFTLKQHLCRDTSRRASRADAFTWGMKLLSGRVLQVQAGQNTPFLSRPLPELRQQRLSLQLKVLLVMWDSSRVALTLISRVGNQRDWAYLVWGMVWFGFFFPIHLLDSCCSPASCHLLLRNVQRCSGCYFGSYRIKHGESSSTAGVFRSQGFRDSCAAQRCLCCHFGGVSTNLCLGQLLCVILGAVRLSPGRRSPEQCPAVWWCPSPRISLMDSGCLFKDTAQAAAAGLGHSATLRNPIWQWDEQTQGFTPLLIVLVNETACGRT